MKTVARISLMPGMELGEDVFSYKNELILPAGTVLDENAIHKLTHFSVTCVTVKDAVDYATTHFEKVRLSDGFKHFESVYKVCMETYRDLMLRLAEHGTVPDVDTLFSIHGTICACTRSGEQLLDYLYNMLPNEDEMTHSHCLNSALICGVFGKWLGLSSEDIRTFIACGFFYDIGKLKLPDRILWKSGKLSDFEYNWMKTHTAMGYEMIKDLHLDAHVINATLMHHERCDGSGYPSRLVEEQIDDFALYTAIVDSYEAMTSARSYRQTMIPFQVIANFEKTGFEKYNAAILRPILKHIAETQLGMTVRLNDDREASVILINRTALSRPLLKCGDELIDLAVKPELSITALL